MRHHTADFKHHVLLQYRAGQRGCGFQALATRFAIAGGKHTVAAWHARWDGTMHSLQRKAGSGRKRILSAEQVDQYVVQAVRRSNRQHKPVHYAPLRAAVIAATRKQPSLRTVQRYGRDTVIKQKRTKKRTAEECTYTAIAWECSVSRLCTDISCFGVQWVQITARRLQIPDESFNVWAHNVFCS
jgi:hypothetical protein